MHGHRLIDSNNTVVEPPQYSVNLWCSHPDEENDDCGTGFFFEKRFDAVTKFVELQGSYEYPFVEISGPDVYQVERTKAPLTDNSRDNREWLHERAMEAGMLHGIEAYNEVYGY